MSEVYSDTMKGFGSSISRLVVTIAADRRQVRRKNLVPPYRSKQVPDATCESKSPMRTPMSAKEGLATALVVVSDAALKTRCLRAFSWLSLGCRASEDLWHMSMLPMLGLAGTCELRSSTRVLGSAVSWVWSGLCPTLLPYTYKCAYPLLDS